MTPSDAYMPPASANERELDEFGADDACDDQPSVTPMPGWVVVSVLDIAVFVS